MRAALVATGLIAGLVGVVYVVTRGRTAAQGVIDAANRAGQAINPLNRDNVAYGTVNAIGGALAGGDLNAPGMSADGSWSLGAWAFDILNPGTAAAVRNVSGPVQQPTPQQIEAMAPNTGYYGGVFGTTDGYGTNFGLF